MAGYASAEAVSVPTRLLSVSYAPASAHSNSRIAALDGLRGVAILLVLSRHALFGMPSSSPIVMKILSLGQLSWSGVDLFFVLSGFLIGGILLDARCSPRYYETFYIRRAYRILPLYGLVCGMFLFHHLPFQIVRGDLGAVSPLTIPWLSYLTFTQNFWMAQSGWYGQMAMAATWSLAVEEQFYLTAPFVIRKIREKWLPALLLVVIAGAPLLRTAIRANLVHGDFACYVLMPCRADALCWGVLTAYIVRQPGALNILLSRRRTLRIISTVLFLGIVWMTYRHYEQSSAAMTSWGYSWLAMFYTGCLVITICESKGILHRILCNPWLMRLGTLAYCTYLLHLPLIIAGRTVLKHIFASANAVWLLGGWSGVAMTILLANLSWNYLEKPMLRRGHSYQY